MGVVILGAVWIVVVGAIVVVVVVVGAVKIVVVVGEMVVVVGEIVVVVVVVGAVKIVVVVGEMVVVVGEIVVVVGAVKVLVVSSGVKVGAVWIVSTVRGASSGVNIGVGRVPGATACGCGSGVGRPKRAAGGATSTGGVVPCSAAKAVWSRLTSSMTPALFCMLVTPSKTRS